MPGGAGGEEQLGSLIHGSAHGRRGDSFFLHQNERRPAVDRFDGVALVHALVVEFIADGLGVVAELRDDHRARFTRALRFRAASEW